MYPGDRKIELHDKTKLDIPGPCQYTVPSDFGNVLHSCCTQSNFAIPKRNRGRNDRTSNGQRLGLTTSLTMKNLKTAINKSDSKAQTAVNSPRDNSEIKKTLNASINGSSRKLVVSSATKTGTTGNGRAKPI